MKTCEDSAPTGVEAVSSMMSSGSDESDSICCVVCWRFVGCVGLSSCDVWKGRLVFVGGCCSVDAVDFFGVVEVFVLEVDVLDVVDGVVFGAGGFVVVGFDVGKGVVLSGASSVVGVDVFDAVRGDVVHWLA